MSWEFSRTPWSKLRAAGSAAKLPEAIQALLEARSKSDAERAYWRVDNTVVVQGGLFEAALPTVPAVLGALQRSTGVGQSYLLDLLVQIGAGQPAPEELASGNTSLKDHCVEEISRGAAIYFHLLQYGTQTEQLACVDLLGLCALRDSSLRDRLVWYLRRLSEESLEPGPAKFIDGWLAELSTKGSLPLG